MVMTSAQFGALEDGLEAALLVRAENYLRRAHATYAMGRTDDNIREMIEQVRSFGLAHDLRDEVSFLQLIDQALGDGWPDPLPALTTHFLTRRGFSEAKRIADGRQSLGVGIKLIARAQFEEREVE